MMGIFSGKRPKDIGVNNGQLKGRPKTPNCVLSQGSKSNIEAFALGDDAAAAFAKIKSVIEGMEGLTLIEDSDTYLYAECKTPLMGYIDDLEFSLSADENVAHVRSASRLGKSDMGKNRKTVEAIRKQFKD